MDFDSISLKPDAPSVELYPDLGVWLGAFRVGISVSLSLQQSLKPDAPSVELYPDLAVWLGAFPSLRQFLMQGVPSVEPLLAHYGLRTRRRW